MNVENYRVFIKTIETENITKAAQELGYTQSGVSRIIGKLEEEFGMSLVIRTRSGIMLQENAAPLLKIMSNIVRLEDELYKVADKLEKKVKNTIKIVTFHTVSVEVLPQLIRDFCRMNPSVNFDIIERGKYSYILEQVAENDADIAFITEFACEDADFVPLIKDEYFVVMAEGHPLCTKEKITEEMLGQYPFFVSDASVENDDLHQLIDRIKDKNTSIKMDMLDDSMTISMVEKDFGISIVPGLFLKGLTKRVIAKPLDGEYYRTIGMIIRQNSYNNDIVCQFAKYVGDYFS